jgi:FkbM family methyltransferase
MTWSFRHVGNGRLLTETKNGFHCVYDVDDLSVGLNILRDGCHEPWVTHVLNLIIKPGDVIIDVGSNIGCHSVEMASATGRYGKVHCFEPNPQVLPLLKHNIHINGFPKVCSIYPIAVLDYPVDDAIMHLYDQNYGGASIGHVAPGNTIIDDIKVKTTSIDIMFGGSHVDVLKVDAEGSDGRVIRGAMDTLREARAVIFEREISSGDSFIDDAFRDLVSMGFKSYIITQPDGDLVNFCCDLEGIDKRDILMWRQ